jgi:hypothetical protein
MANTDPYVLAVAYAAGITPPILAAATSVKYPIPLREDSQLSRPMREYRYALQQFNNHAAPKNLVSGREVPATGEFALDGPVCDAVPFYLHFNAAAAAAGDDDFNITENVSGLPVETIVHEEINLLGKVYDWHPAYATGFELTTKNGWLWAKLNGKAGGYTAGNKLTDSPSALFGNNTPLDGYSMFNPNNTFTWNSVEMRVWFAGVSVKSTSELDFMEYLHTSTLGAFNRHRRTFDPIGVSLVVTDDADLRSIENAIGTSSTLSLKFARSATDYIIVALANTTLMNFDIEPVNWKSDSGVVGEAQMATLLFTPPVLGAGTTRITVTERQATANAAATYQL